MIEYELSTGHRGFTNMSKIEVERMLEKGVFIIKWECENTEKTK